MKYGLLIILILSMVLVFENTYAISKEECKQFCPDLCAVEPEENQETILKNIDINKLIKEENVSLITIFIDRKNNVTVLYKAEEMVSNIEEIKKIQEENIENINKESKNEKAWRTGNHTLAKETYAIEKLNRDYVKYKFNENIQRPLNIWDKIISLFK